MSSAGRGRTQQTKGVAESVLREKSKRSHRDLDPQALLDPGQTKARLKLGLCPYCDRGPFDNVVKHTSWAHGMGPLEVRDAAGLPYNYVLTSPELHASNVQRGMKRDMKKIRANRTSGNPRNVSEAGRRKSAERLAGVRDIAVEAARAASQEAADNRLRLAEPRIREAAASGIALSVVAAEIGLSPAVIGRYARKLGLPDGRSLRGAAASRATDMRALTQRQNEKLAQRRSQTLVAWKETPGDWDSLLAMATSTGRSPKQMRAYLQRIGASVPDGRKNRTPDHG